MSIAFKEWALICDQLGAGRQSIILRKGGIAEGREGFRFRHDEFFLFPTLFHEQAAKLKLQADAPFPVRETGLVQIDLLARIEWTAAITRLDQAHQLAPFHIWRDEVIEKRFRYNEKDELSLAFVRVYRLRPRFEFADSPKFGGCRSWVTIPDPSPGTAEAPVLADAENASRSRELRSLLGLD